MRPMDRTILGASSVGALVDKTPDATKALIVNMSLNFQQFTTRNNPTILKIWVNEIQDYSTSDKNLEKCHDDLT